MVSISWGQHTLIFWELPHVGHKSQYLVNPDHGYTIPFPINTSQYLSWDRIVTSCVSVTHICVSDTQCSCHQADFSGCNVVIPSYFQERVCAGFNTGSLSQGDIPSLYTMFREWCGCSDWKIYLFISSEVTFVITTGWLRWQRERGRERVWKRGDGGRA